ncbi:MAG: hypothetical protein CM1200mP26_16150 [Acidimicrobiales bacterium]|nr:MAG: hypothetical protein CM1200mP26_16150 [Acidimicrobiales bacterium]
MAVTDALAVLLAVEQVTEGGDALFHLVDPGRTTWPEMANMRVPGEASEPILRYAAAPLAMIHGTLDRVSTLLTMVGCPYSPMAAGK